MLSSTVQGLSFSAIPMVPHPHFCPCPGRCPAQCCGKQPGAERDGRHPASPAPRAQRHGRASSTPGLHGTHQVRALLRGRGDDQWSMQWTGTEESRPQQETRKHLPAAGFCRGALQAKVAAGEVKQRRLQVPQKLFLDRSTRRWQQQPPRCKSAWSKTQSSGRALRRAGSEVLGDHTAAGKPREGV